LNSLVEETLRLYFQSEKVRDPDFEIYFRDLDRSSQILFFGWLVAGDCQESEG